MNDFWSINDFFKSEELIPCTTQKELKSIAFLLDDNSNENSEGDSIIAENVFIKIPEWSAISLFKSDVIRINEPAFLSKSFYNQIITNSVIINFKNKNNYLYDVCISLIPCLNLEYNWYDILWNCSVERFIYLYKNTLNDSYENENLIKKLCYREKELYKSFLLYQEKLKDFYEYFNMINKKKYNLNEHKHFNLTNKNVKRKVN